MMVAGGGGGAGVGGDGRVWWWQGLFGYDCVGEWKFIIVCPNIQKK